MPEVAGDAALRADPFDVASISKAMKTIYNNKDLREELIQKGFKRKTLFTWKRTADLLWESIEKAVG